MSSSLNPSPVPLEAPEPGLKPVPPVPNRFGRRHIGLLVALLLVAGAATAWFLRSRAQAKPAAALEIRTATVRTGALVRVIRIAGSTTAGKYANIIAPILRGQEGQRGLSLVKLIPSGTYVKEGDLLAQLDTTQAKDHISDVEAMVTQAEADIRRAQANQAITEENMRQSIRVAKAAADKARLDADASEIRTPIDKELLKLSLEENEAAFKEMQNDLQTNIISQRAEIRVEEIDVIRTKNHLGRHTYDLPHFDIHSPIGGLAVMLSLRRGQGADMYQVQEGDQISPRQPFMKVVDPTSIQVFANVNQVASEELRIGQPVMAHFDAFPDIALPGKIASVGAIAGSVGRGGSAYVRWIPVKVTLAKQDPRVIPDLSASADVVVHREENATLVPLDTVFKERGKDVVYVRTPNGFSRREIQLGSASNTEAAVVSGLRAGDQVALQRPPVQAQ